MNESLSMFAKIQAEGLMTSAPPSSHSFPISPFFFLLFRFFLEDVSLIFMLCMHARDAIENEKKTVNSMDPHHIGWNLSCLRRFLKTEWMNLFAPKSASQPTFWREIWRRTGRRRGRMIKDLKDNDLQTSFHAKRNNWLLKACQQESS